MPKAASGGACDYCHSAALYLVTQDLPGAPAAQACRAHVAVAVDKLAGRSASSSAEVCLLGKGAALGGAGELAGQVAEQVRRLGAFSAGDPQRALAMEDELYRGVLALIAQGARSPAMLAATALQSQNYDLNRRKT